MDTNTSNEASSEKKAKHMREALQSLPSFDFDESPQSADEADSTPADSPNEPQSDSDSEVTIVTHEMQVDAQEEKTESPSESTEESPSESPEGSTESSVQVDSPTKQSAPVVNEQNPTSDAEEERAKAEQQEDAIAATAALSSLAPTPQTYSDPVEPAQEQTVMATPLSEPISEGMHNYETPFSQEANQDARQRRRKVLRRILIACAALIGALILIYVAVSLYFTAHFLPNTTVNGEDVSGMAISDLSSYVSSIGDNYKTTVSGDNVDLKVSGNEINFVYDGNAYSKQASEQIDAWRWPLELNQKHEYVVDQAISYDEAKLEELVRAAVDKANEGSSQPTNATMKYDEAAGKFVVVPDALGTAVNPDAVVPVVSQGVSMLQTNITLGNKELVQPTITKDDKKLNGNIDTVNGMLDKKITLRIANKDATSIDKNLMSGWFTLDEQSNINVNADKIKEWCHGPLSEQFDSTGTKRTYTRPDGKEITVEGSSEEYNYGWSLDSDALTDIISQNLKTNNMSPIEVPMLKTAATWNPGKQDWPARYIDVDLSEQHVRMYDESSNVIWESDCVSGEPVYGGGTDTGVYFVYLKKSPETLKGLDYNGDGQPDYEVPVTYWMPFDGGEGLHDATSRGAFGGNIYTYDGSHGCVNLPYSAAEALWGIVEVGDPVVVHW